MIVFLAKHFHALFRAAVLLSLMTALSILTPSAALAQASPEIAKCGELQSEGAKFQMELCSAHLGCRMVLSIQNTCAKAEKFITNLSNVVGEGVKTIFGYRKELTSEKVFEASLSDKQRAVEKDKGWHDLIDPIRSAVSKVKETGKEHSPSFVEVGDTSKTGQLEGNGFRFRKLPDTVEIERIVGVYPGWTGIKTDMVDVAKETREVTERIMFKDTADNYTPGLVGKSIFSDGSEYSGTRILGKDRFLRHGKGTLITADGRQMEGSFVNDGFSEGVIRRRDGTLIAKGKWDSSGNLFQGQTFDSTGTTVIQNVDRPGDKAKAEAAAKEARERALRDAEAKRKADAALAESQFRDSLNTLNAGQLFAKADELSSGGDKVKAREVLRTLLSRFPDHPLTANAANQLSNLAQNSATISSAQNGSSNTTSGGGAGGGVANSGISGRPFQECADGEKNNTALSAKINAIPRNDTVKLIRGAHFASRWMVENYSKCLPDPRAKEAVAQFRKTMDETMQTCKQLSSNQSICEVSPL
jgi:hypothetical protein